MLTALIVVASLVVLAFTALLVLYNRLVRLRNKTDNAWHQIDVQPKKRYDLVPEIAAVVEGYALTLGSPWGHPGVRHLDMNLYPKQWNAAVNSCQGV